MKNTLLLISLLLAGCASTPEQRDAQVRNVMTEPLICLGPLRGAAICPKNWE